MRDKLKMVLGNGIASRNPSQPSPDKIDPSKGYVKGNIRVISWRANNLRCNGTLEEFEALVLDTKYLEKLKEKQ